MESNRLLPIVIVLSIGLAGVTYLYLDARSIEVPQVNTSLVDGLTDELDQARDMIETLGEEITELENEKDALDEQVKELGEVEKILPKPDIVLDFSDEGDVKNVILLIGDGMGIGQLTAAEIMNGEEDLTITSLPYTSLVTTHSSSNYVTDSAASATAMATGHKTRNGRIAVSPEREDLFTVLEDAEQVGKATGIISTARATHATPASFLSHVLDRGMEEVIAAQLLESGVDVALGGGRGYFDGLDPEAAGYIVVTNSTELELVDSGMVLGLFSYGYMNYERARSGSGQPSLSEMTAKSLELLSVDPEGFFLMVEGGRIDHASHANDFDNTVAETLEFDATVQLVLEYAVSRNDTLVLVTSDHETGGLSIVGGYQSGGGMQVDWVTDDHVGSLVPVYAYGPRASEVTGFRDNTDIGSFLLSVVE